MPPCAQRSSPPKVSSSASLSFSFVSPIHTGNLSPSATFISRCEADRSDTASEIDPPVARGHASRESVCSAFTFTRGIYRFISYLHQQMGGRPLRHGVPK